MLEANLKAKHTQPHEAAKIVAGLGAAVTKKAKEALRASAISYTKLRFRLNFKLNEDELNIVDSSFRQGLWDEHLAAGLEPESHPLMKKLSGERERKEREMEARDAQRSIAEAQAALLQQAGEGESLAKEVQLFQGQAVLGWETARERLQGLLDQAVQATQAWKDVVEEDISATAKDRWEVVRGNLSIPEECKVVGSLLILHGFAPSMLQDFLKCPDGVAIFRAASVQEEYEVMKVVLESAVASLKRVTCLDRGVLKHTLLVIGASDVCEASSLRGRRGRRVFRDALRMI